MLLVLLVLLVLLLLLLLLLLMLPTLVLVLRVLLVLLVLLALLVVLLLLLLPAHAAGIDIGTVVSRHCHGRRRSDPPHVVGTVLTEPEPDGLLVGQQPTAKTTKTTNNQQPTTKTTKRTTRS